MRAELAWSRIMVKWVFIESLAGDSFGSGHSYYSGSFIFWVFGMFQVLEGSGKRQRLG